MPNDRLYSQLTEVFRDVFDDDSIVLTPETTASDIAGWDSVAHVDLIVSIETRMKIKFKTSELGSLHNVGQLAGLIEYKLESTKQPA
jgi:acyl carrier protein